MPITDYGFLKKYFFLFFILSIISCKNENYQKITKQDAIYKKSAFVGTETCKSCHTKEFKEWQNSHHDLAMQIVNFTTILGDFNNVTYKSKGVNYRFFKKENSFYVNTEGEGGKYQDYKIAYTFGVTPLQQYLIEFPDGKYQCLLVAWDVKEQRWYDLQPNLKTHHDEWMHWTGGSMTWNNMCADCHSTNLQKKFNATTEKYNTTFSIINVSCEACHGPSSTHVEYYENEDKYKDIDPPKFYMDTSMTSKELVQKCARCHSRRNQLTASFDYKDDFLDHYNPSLIVDPVYELDGQIKDEDYVYGSFVQSKMYHNGVSCKDCHNVHSLKLKKEGNALCLSCHEPKYDTYSHHFHKQNTEASQCINCHMAGKTYMGNDFRRDHSFRVPRPDQTVTYSTPNACNTCHTDKNAQWASNFIKSKYGEKRPDHFSEFLLAGYHGDNEAFYKVFSKNNNPEIIRATALSQYGNQPLSEDEINRLIAFVNDSSALVRNEVVLTLGKLNQIDLSKIIEPLLLDSVRLVRISAARYFNMKNNSLIENDIYKTTQEEYLNTLKVNVDFASGQHQIALYNQAKGNTEDAVKAYQKAIEIDNYYNSSRMNLALLEYNRGNIQTAEELYLKITKQEPDYSYPYFMLGLLYNENGNSEKSLEYLSLACDKQPVISSAFYNYGLKLQEKALYRKSILVVNKALKTFPFDEGLLYVKLLGEMKTNQNKEAYSTCAKLLKISPNNTNYKMILTSLE
jgi:tetratricopeptide (TPR) repeat protein